MNKRAGPIGICRRVSLHPPRGSRGADDNRTSIFLIAVGAILYFATNLQVAHVDLDIVGLILMLAGLAGLILGFIQQGMWSRQSRREVTIEDRREPTDPRY
jgi:Domain of unknown function (DUF6458)